jgi:hypothetical protein
MATLTSPDLTPLKMVDKPKQDTLAKIVTCFQIQDFVLNASGYLQDLAITAMELSALAIVVYSIVTSLCGLNKPLNVRIPGSLHRNISLVGLFTCLRLKATIALARRTNQAR